MILQGACIGDSETAGTVGNFSLAQGGRGSWIELVADAIANTNTFGPLIGAGMRLTIPTIYGGGGNEWTFTGSWTDDASSDAWDVIPCGLGRHASGAGIIAKWTKPAAWRPVVAIAVSFVDFTGGGNWRWRIDGGTWNNHGQTLQHNNHIARFHIAQAVATSIEFEASSDGVAAAPIHPFAVEPYFADPLTASGFVMHNLGQNAQQLHGMLASASGDRMAVFDAFDFDFVHCAYINDVTLNDVPGWASDLTAFYNRVAPGALVGFTSIWEVPYGVGPTVQANYRAQTKTTGALLGAKLHDTFDDWSANGFADNASAVTAGLLLSSDGIHPTQLGHKDLARRLYPFIRSQLMRGVGSTPVAYPVRAAAVKPAYIAARSGLAYGASPPPEIAP